MQLWSSVYSLAARNKISFIASVSLGMTLTLLGTVSAAERRAALNVRVESVDSGLAGYQVSLYASFPIHGPKWKLLGSGITDDEGNIQITYSVPRGLVTDQQPVLFVEAERGSAMLVSAIGEGENIPSSVVVNERTTVATANAYAQFIKGSKIEGNRYAMVNGVGMAANFANPLNGDAGIIVSSTPNGTWTSTFPTFNSLNNVVAACVADAVNCASLFKAATLPGGSEPTTVLQALANLVKNPSYPGYPDNSRDPIFQLSQLDAVYQPALTERPTNWLLFLKITGGFYRLQDSTNLMDGPGNFAIDEKGFAWVDDNYVPNAEGQFACAGERLLLFDPSGAPVPNTPFFGGGLSGAGYGITLDPQGNVWVGNFGFQDAPCQFLPQAAPHNSVSKFAPDGNPISPAEGYTNGNISWPQGTVSDRKGNIWMASCGNDTVTEYPQGDPSRAINIPLGPTPASGDPQMKPFGVAIDLAGNVWVTDNHSNNVSVISPQGKLLATLPGTYDGKTILTHPVGNAGDSRGNIWVANSDWLDVPCPGASNLGSATHPSIALFEASTHKSYPGSPFTGGGLTVPWGIAVDGDNTVWVFNFGAVPAFRRTDIPTGISHFCGIDTGKCPPGMHTGDSISPSTGYRSDAIERITGAQIDPSGNIWITNNWKNDVNPLVNPGGNAIVIAIGAAAPIKTPLIGPPIPFRK